MQKSGIFVVYRVVDGTARDLEYQARLDAVQSIQVGVQPVSKNLADARQMPKDIAFREAIRLGGNWAAGEVVSTKAGLAVDF